MSEHGEKRYLRELTLLGLFVPSSHDLTNTRHSFGTQCMIGAVHS